MATTARARARTSLAARCIAAGLLIAAALPPWGWWPLALAGVALLDRLIADQPAWSRFRRGWLVFLACFAPSMLWIGAFTPPGYLAAIAYYAAVHGTACALTPARQPYRWLALPGAMVLAEGSRARWPFGGVPVSTFALGQVASPLASVARIGGPLLLSLVTCAVGVALSAAVARRWRATGLAAAAVLGAVALAAIAPRGHDIGALRVADVQGGGPQGTTRSEVDPELVFQRHLDATTAISSGVDLVLLPENVIDVEGPVDDSPEGAAVAAEAQRLDASVLVGATEGDGGGFHNVQAAFGPDGRLIDRYEKVRRVPFGEYVPLRWLLEPIAGGQLITRDAIPGADPATLSTPKAKVGVVISWEVFFADRARAAIRQGGEVLLNPTNGSSFTGAIVQAQQLASSRLRAIEEGRWVVQAAPTGYSAIITPDGRVEQRTSISEQRVLVATVQRRAGLTWANRLGDWPAVLLSLLGLALAWGARHARARARRP